MIKIQFYTSFWKNDAGNQENAWLFSQIMLQRHPHSNFCPFIWFYSLFSNFGFQNLNDRTPPPKKPVKIFPDRRTHAIMHFPNKFTRSGGCPTLFSSEKIKTFPEKMIKIQFYTSFWKNDTGNQENARLFPQIMLQRRPHSNFCPFIRFYSLFSKLWISGSEGSDPTSEKTCEISPLPQNPCNHAFSEHVHTI